jgi:hypothetical protein
MTGTWNSRGASRNQKFQTLFLVGVHYQRKEVWRQIRIRASGTESFVRFASCQLNH